MKNEVLLAIIKKLIEDHSNKVPIRGPRGLRGAPGNDGKSFNWQEHLEEITLLVKNASLKFKDLTEEEIESLKGPLGEKGDKGDSVKGDPGSPGLKGDKGDAGRNFHWDDHRIKIEAIIKKYSLKFEDFTAEQIESLRGPKGEDGGDGKDFNFSENRDQILEVVSESLMPLLPDLKLKFEDLNREEIELLRLKFSDLSEEEVNSLKLKFEDLSKEERDSLKLRFSDLNFKDIDQLKLKFKNLNKEEIESLKLKFSDLTPEDISKLKLKFDDLTPEERYSLRGPRGQRGKVGPRGESIKGPRGEIGPGGLRGLKGDKGDKGNDGLNAPVPIDIYLREEGKNKYCLVVEFSDGSFLETNSITLPAPVYQSGPQIIVAGGGSGSSTPGPKGDPGDPGEKGDKGDQGDPGPAGGEAILYDVACDEDVFVGSAVYLTQLDGTPIPMEDWTSLSSLFTLDPMSYTIKAKLGLADDYDTSNIIGIVEDKPTSETCDIRFFGPTSDLFVGIDVMKEYYLSDTIPGAIVTEDLKPTSPGSVILKIGQAISDSKLLILRGERRIIT